MNEYQAILSAKVTYPQHVWQVAYAVLPSSESDVSSASWLVCSGDGEYLALVDGQPGSMLFKRV